MTPLADEPLSTSKEYASTPPADERVIQGYIEGNSKDYLLVNRWIRAVVGNRRWGLHHQREDILQEVHKRLFENLSEGRFRATSSLRTYVTRIAKYTCIEFLRVKIRTRSVNLDSLVVRDPGPGPEQSLASSEWTKQAGLAMARLPESCRRLFDMIFVERLSYQEIGRRLGVAEGTVKSRTWRCRSMLDKMLKTKGLDVPRRSSPAR